MRKTIAIDQEKVLRYTYFRELCNSSVGEIYCDGLRFATCPIPERCSSQISFDVLDPPDDKIANAWQNVLNGTVEAILLKMGFSMPNAPTFVTLPVPSEAF